MEYDIKGSFGNGIFLALLMKIGFGVKILKIASLRDDFFLEIRVILGILKIKNFKLT
jgi:hypothetical protein